MKRSCENITDCEVKKIREKLKTGTVPPGEDTDVRQFLDTFRRRARYSEWQTTKGNTQAAEKAYILLATQILDEMGIVYKAAAASKTGDLSINFPSGPVVTEWKKIDSGWVFKCNDTLPSSGVYYVLIHTQHRMTVMVHGPDLIREDYGRIHKAPHVSKDDHVRQVLSYHDEIMALRQRFKDDVNCSYVKCPRANHSFDGRTHFWTKRRKGEIKLRAQKKIDRFR
tara:strand:- start:205 stop:879 length:675 start_codon:yes stop_codon:yes gene_type:complete